MNAFGAKNNKQLGVCLRMLYAEGISVVKVKSFLNQENRFEFSIITELGEPEFTRLNDRFDTLIN